MSCGCTTLNTKLNFVIDNTLFIYDKEEDDKEEDDKEEDDKEEDDKEEDDKEDNEKNVKLVHRTIKKMIKILTNVQIATTTSLSSHKYATPRICRVCTNCNRCTNHYCICQSKTYIN